MITVKVGSAAPEVWLLKTWLNGVLKPSPNLPLEMPFGPNTKKAVAQFQQSKSLQADGAVGALTWRELADAAKQVDVPFVDAHNRPTWDLWPLYLKNRKLRPIDVGRFRTAFSECLRDGNKAPGLETFLGFINDDQSLLNADLRWVAYLLATAKWESLHTFQPLFERGCVEMNPGDCPQYIPSVNRTHYHKAIPCPNTDKTNYPELCGITKCPSHRTQHIYHGRGYIQLTWYDNYAAMGKRLGLKLAHTPEHALLEENAYKIIVSWFQSGPPAGNLKDVPLSKYIDANRCNYYDARELVNLDKATVPGWTNGVSNGKMIEDYAKKFEVCLAYSMGHNSAAWPVPMGPGSTGW